MNFEPSHTRAEPHFIDAATLRLAFTLIGVGLFLSGVLVGHLWVSILVVLDEALRLVQPFETELEEIAVSILVVLD